MEVTILTNCCRLGVDHQDNERLLGGGGNFRETPHSVGLNSKEPTRFSHGLADM